MERKIKNLKSRIDKLRSKAKMHKFTGQTAAEQEALREITILNHEINEIEASKGGQSD